MQHPGVPQHPNARPSGTRRGGLHGSTTICRSHSSQRANRLRSRRHRRPGARAAGIRESRRQALRLAVQDLPRQHLRPGPGPGRSCAARLAARTRGDAARHGGHAHRRAAFARPGGRPTGKQP